MTDSFEVRASDGAVSRVTRAGERGPALIFIHGVGANASSWQAQLAALSGDYRCYAIDLRGNGVPKPEPEPALITRAGFALDVLSLLDRESIDRCTIVGNSLGGVVALELWEQAAGRINAMVFVGSFARYPDSEAYVRRVIENVRGSGDMQSFARQRAEALGLHGEKAATLIAQMGAKTVDSYIASTHATWTGDYRHTLRTVSVPSLVVCGANDTIAPPALSEEIAREIADAEFALIDGAGHITHADAPEVFNRRLVAFLESAQP